MLPVARNLKQQKVLKWRKRKKEMWKPLQSSSSYSIALNSQSDSVFVLRTIEALHEAEREREQEQDVYHHLHKMSASLIYM